MPDVISNTTPLLYLHQLGCLDFLPQLYQQVFVPQAVLGELRQGEGKGFDVPSLNALAWVRVEAVAPLGLLRVTGGLDSGEHETIALGLAKPDPLLILDDAAARAYAQTLGRHARRPRQSKTIWTDHRHSSLSGSIGQVGILSWHACSHEDT